MAQKATFVGRSAVPREEVLPPEDGEVDGDADPDGAIVEEEEAPAVLEADGEILIYLRKPWSRDIQGVEVGDVIGSVRLRDGVDLNLLLDAVRYGFAGEERPV